MCDDRHILLKDCTDDLQLSMQNQKMQMGYNLGLDVEVFGKLWVLWDGAGGGGPPLRGNRNQVFKAFYYTLQFNYWGHYNSI